VRTFLISVDIKNVVLDAVTCAAHNGRFPSGERLTVLSLSFLQAIWLTPAVVRSCWGALSLVRQQCLLEPREESLCNSRWGFDGRVARQNSKCTLDAH
jgi:hypothetical protein